MTETRTPHQPRRLYQPPLPWKGEPALVPARGARGPVPAGRPSATKGRRTTSNGPSSTDRVSYPRRPVAYGDWRLDEKTRRAGRQGVAAARAALAGTVRPAERRQADAA